MHHFDHIFIIWRSIICSFLDILIEDESFAQRNRLSRCFKQCDVLFLERFRAFNSAKYFKNLIFLFRLIDGRCFLWPDVFLLELFVNKSVYFWFDLRTRMILSSFTGASTKCFKALREQLISVSLFLFFFGDEHMSKRERARWREREGWERDECGGRGENRWMKRKRECELQARAWERQTALSWSRPETNLEIQGL